MAGQGSGRIGFKVMTVSIWIATLTATAPVMYFTDIVAVGPDRTQIEPMCRLTWITNTRSECERIIAQVANLTCPVNTGSCGGQAALTVERGGH